MSDRKIAIETAAPSFWTVESLAKERWQCHPLTVRRLIKAGQLQAHRFGKLVRISHTDLLKYEADASK